ncbi:MAG: DUF2244 domain-containing protein [Pseudomonadota bacterium]
MKSSPITIELYPYRSLSRKGFIILMSCIAAVSFIAGVAFLLMGAWPVFGFFGLDVALIWWAIKRNYRDAECQENICISDEEVTITRMKAHRPDQTQTLVRAWAKVRLEEDAERELIGRLFLSSREMVTEIGSFLAPYDRKSLAATLKEILARPRI